MSLIDHGEMPFVCKVLQVEVADVKQDLELIQAFWTKYGCSIMTDGWNDMKQQNIIKIFFIYL
jgi:hypothetical protein